MMKAQTFRDREADSFTHRTSENKSRKVSRLKWQKRIIFVSVIFGILVATAVIFIPIYVTLTIASQTTTTASIGISLPSQCYNYTNDTDATRLTTYSATTSACDNSFSTPKWVRFTGGGATQMATSDPAAYRCGTNAGGWLASPLPTAIGTNTTGLVCYTWSNNPCNSMNWISITNCNGFYVYLLSNVPGCTDRYCTQ